MTLKFYLRQSLQYFHLCNFFLQAKIADLMSQKSSAQKLFQRIVIIASSLALVGSSVFFLIEALISTSSESDPQPLDSNTSIEQLKAQATGYEKVLAREPNNAAALQNLAKIRLQLQDYQGAIVPLEKLVQLYPNEPQLKQLLTAVQQQTRSKQPQNSYPANQ
jgi:cytochrome c-type biogenesis protein CcmH/NrfG